MTEPVTMRPPTPQAAAEFIGSSAHPIRITGAGTKAGIGRKFSTGSLVLSTEQLTEVTYFEPTEFVLSAQAGVRLETLSQMLDEHALALPFAHPFTQGTLGGAIASNLGGGERLELGAPRDNVLGMEYVNARGELLKAGGRVMKNVTGLDIARGLCGSWGRLALITEVSLKVVPKVRYDGIEQFEPAASQASVLWRVSLPAGKAEQLSDGLSGINITSQWQGRLLWLEGDEAAQDVHALAASAGGHALRLRGEGKAFQPRSMGLKSVEARVEQAFGAEKFDSQYDD